MMAAAPLALFLLWGKNREGELRERSRCTDDSFVFAR